MMQRITLIGSAIWLAILAAPLNAPAQDVLAYQGATIETVGKAGRIETGTILIRDGKNRSGGG